MSQYDKTLNKLVVPAEMIREYHLGLTQQEIATKWEITVFMARKILLERGVKMEHPSYRKL